MPKDFDVNKDFMLPIIQEMDRRISDTNQQIQENNYWIGFTEGFRFGVEEGVKRAQREFQMGIGLQPSGHDLYVEDFKTQADGPVTSKREEEENA